MNFKISLQVISAMTLVLGLTSCKDIDGSLVVNKAFNLLDRGSPTNVQAGTYSANLDFKKNNVVVTIERSGANVKATVHIPDNSQIPENGKFEIKSAQSGQPFDILGVMQTQHSQSALQRGVESCQYQSNENYCTPQGCFNQIVTRWGQRQIEYYDQVTDRKINFDITQTGSAKNVWAAFTGTDRDASRVITYATRCF